MTETAQQRDERRALVILRGSARHDSNMSIARAIAASDAAAGMDYDALRNLVGKMVERLRGYTTGCSLCGGSIYVFSGGDDDNDCPVCKTARALIAQAQEVLK